MASAKKMKYLSIDLQYRDENEVMAVLERIANLVQMGVGSYKGKGNHHSFEFQVNHLLDPDTDYRVEEIDGQQVLIIQSKMNKDV